MAPKRSHRLLRTAARWTPGLKKIPVLRLLALAEVALLAQEHMARLDRQERRRLMQLVRIGRGQPRNLTAQERGELHDLMVKVAPRELAAEAAQRLSPMPIPDAMVRRFGRQR